MNINKYKIELNIKDIEEVCNLKNSYLQNKLFYFNKVNSHNLLDFLHIEIYKNPLIYISIYELKDDYFLIYHKNLKDDYIYKVDQPYQVLLIINEIFKINKYDYSKQ